MDRPHSSHGLFAHADALLAQRRYRDAVLAYLSALQLEPGHADGWFNLGYALRHEGRFADAMDAYGHALRYGAKHPEQLHLNRAAILADHLRRDDDAEIELRAALTVAPGYAPALLNLGNLHEERGRRDAAIECYRTLLAPGLAQADAAGYEALARLASLHPPDGPDDPLHRQLQDAAYTSLPIEDRVRANLCFAFGRACDAMGDYARALDAFGRGQEHAHRGYPPYDRARAEAMTAALIGGAHLPEHVAATPADTPAPLFICGMFRSGSTLLEQVLAGHPQVIAGGEIDLLQRLVAGPLAPFPQSLVTFDAQRASTMARRYLEETRARLPPDAMERRYVTDKRPDNFLHIGLIKTLFPTAKIVHTRRNRLDNLLSLYFLHLGPGMPYALDLAAAAHWHAEYERLMEHWKALYPGDIFDLDYDALVAEPEPLLRRLLEFLELDWEDGLLDFHEREGAVKTASVWQVRERLHSRSSGRWKNYEPALRRALGTSFGG